MPATHSKNPLAERLVAPPEELEEQIRLRACELYEERGRENGHELEDWYRAKEQITIKKFRTATA